MLLLCVAAITFWWRLTFNIVFI